MPIEFRCTRCERLLRTPDGTAGKEAKCPQCGAIVRIPTSTAAAPDRASDSAPAAMPAVTNPYQAPGAAGAVVPPMPREPRRCFEPTPIDIGDVLDRAWQIFKVRWPECLAVVWGTAFLLFVAFAIVGLGMLGVVAAMGRKPGPEFIAVILFFYLAVWWQVVAVQACMLKIARGEPLVARDALSVGRLMFPAFIAMLLTGVACLIGFALFIVPGVIIALMFSQFLNIIIDRRAGIIESLKLSMQATRGNKLTLFLLTILMSGVGTIAMSLTCGLASFVVQPFISLVQTVAYLAMTGQSTAVEPLAERERRFG